MLPLQAEICKEAEVIAVTQGLPLPYATNHTSSLPIPPSHKYFLYMFSIGFQGGELRHPVGRSHSLFGGTFFSSYVHTFLILF